MHQMNPHSQLVTITSASVLPALAGVGVTKSAVVGYNIVVWVAPSSAGCRRGAPVFIAWVDDAAALALWLSGLRVHGELLHAHPHAVQT